MFRESENRKFVASPGHHLIIELVASPGHHLIIELVASAGHHLIAELVASLGHHLIIELIASSQLSHSVSIVLISLQKETRNPQTHP